MVMKRKIVFMKISSESKGHLCLPRIQSNNSFIGLVGNLQVHDYSE